jgi:hypothetical protein
MFRKVYGPEQLDSLGETWPREFPVRNAEFNTLDFKSLPENGNDHSVAFMVVASALASKKNCGFKSKTLTCRLRLKPHCGS